MKILKYILILLFTLFSIYSIGWYYITAKTVNEINNKYAGQKIPINNLSHEEYYINFTKAAVSGFPFKLAISIQGWQEENKGALISYKDSIKIGYDLISQAFYIYYDGEIEASYKPLVNAFGAILKIKDYLIKINIPLNKEFLTNIINLKDPIELLNYIGSIDITTKKAQIFDKKEGELFCDKEYEKLHFSFTPAKYYRNLDDLLNDIPKEYKVYYDIQTNAVSSPERIIPVSLLYCFFAMPSAIHADGNIVIKTKAMTVNELSTGLEIHGGLNFFGPMVDLTSFQIIFDNRIDTTQNRDLHLLIDGNIKLKDGVFEKLFETYESVIPRVIAIPGGNIINEEIKYIITNKEVFRFKDLENSDYIFNLDLSSLHNKNRSTLKINNFNIYSENSGFKFTHESILKPYQKYWDAKGVLLIKNYPSIVDYSSNYYYRSGKYRFLSDEARALYIDVNKTFIKEISDYPTSTSNDLSFDYNINSNNVENAKIGSIKFSQIAHLYKFTLYKKLFSMLDPYGNVLPQIKRIIPDFDQEDPIFKLILPKMINNNIKENRREIINMPVPKDNKALLENILPPPSLKKNIDKDLWEKLTQ